MPKVLIKEIDNSAAAFSVTNSFSVLVPGYCGTPVSGYDKDAAAGIALGNNVYEFRSQQDFKNYIGLTSAKTDNRGYGPTLEVARPNSKETTYNDYEKYYRYMSISDFVVEGRSIYKITEIHAEDTDHENYDLFGGNGKLYKTINYSVNNKNADGTTTVENYTVTIKLDKVGINDVDWTKTDGLTYTTSEKYCIIKDGNEGEDSPSRLQMGNQIAWELLGLGYTVLYKVISTSESLADQLSNDDFWLPLKDKSVYNFRYITTGGYSEPNALNQIIKLAEFVNNKADVVESETLLDNSNGRGDCIALCDIDESDDSDLGKLTSLTPKTIAQAIGNTAGKITSSPYAAIFAPQVSYEMSEKAVEPFGGNMTFPASFHYLACAARTFEKYSEWYAVAGYNRGVSRYAIDNTTFNFGEILINTLAPRKNNDYTNKSINLILNERGNYFLWGNRTAKEITDEGLFFQHFLNIRQLCTTIKKNLYSACRQFTFDPNSDLLWINFVNAIKPTLEAMKADQGIKGYKITKVISPEKALLTAKIRIVPIEAVEDFDISILLEDSLGGTVKGTVEEAE